jgi:hypothetical protein
MQIVIEISEEKYKWLKEYIPKADKNSIVGAVVYGVPLPKEHGRLIDADKAISKICGSSCGCHLEECGNDKYCYSVTRIESVPIIIEADEVEE